MGTFMVGTFPSHPVRQRGRCVGTSNRTRARPHPITLCSIIWHYSAAYDFRITVEHIPGTDNNLADSLSRYHTHPTHKETVDKLVVNHQLHICSVDSSIFSLKDSFPMLQRTPPASSKQLGEAVRQT